MWYIIKKEVTKNEEIKKDLLNPKIDYVFKRIFGRQGNESITKSFISAVLNQNITDVVLESDATLPQDILDDKVGILDVKVKIDNHTNCDIEMQIVDKKNIEKRILFYCSKMYVQSIKSGIKQTAKKLKDKGIDINIIHETTGLSIDEINNL